MMGPVERLLSISARLYEHLSTIPYGDDREEFIGKINDLLDERGAIIEELKQSGKSLDGHQLFKHLQELDRGIQERLQKVMAAIKTDMKTLQQSKKTEQQYLNPYSSVRVMDGMYYDGKK